MDKILLWKNEVESSITPFLLNDGKLHPGMLVIPGGGYGCVCESTEGSPIARRFNELGYHAFVLDYRVAPHRFPEPQLDAFRAMKIIRGNASEIIALRNLWKIESGTFANKARGVDSTESVDQAAEAAVGGKTTTNEALR